MLKHKKPRNQYVLRYLCNFSVYYSLAAYTYSENDFSQWIQRDNLFSIHQEQYNVHWDYTETDIEL